MIYVNSLRAPFIPDAEGSEKPRRSLFARLVQAVIEARQREADRVVAAMIERRGGRLTDDLERRIAESVSPGGHLGTGRGDAGPLV